MEIFKPASGGWGGATGSLALILREKPDEGKEGWAFFAPLRDELTADGVSGSGEEFLEC
jgi:hypothetical protein